MRVPIAYGLSWPERIESGAEMLDFLTLKALTFAPPDAARYPGLQLAWETLRGPEGSTCVLNAANEVAVEAFLNRQIRFDQIHQVNEDTLVRMRCDRPQNLVDLLELDRQSRLLAREVVARLK